LKRGDVVVAIDGKEVKDAHTLSRLVAGTAPDTEVAMDIVRDGKEKAVKVKIGTMAQAGEEVKPEQEKTAWGLSVEDLAPQLAESLGLDTGERGVVVSDIEPGSPAAEAGLRQGDLIKEVNRRPIQNLDDYTRTTEKAKKGESVVLLIKRGGSTLYVVLKPASEE
jgi:serine protease Do